MGYKQVSNINSGLELTEKFVIEGNKINTAPNWDIQSYKGIYNTADEIIEWREASYEPMSRIWVRPG